MRRLLIHLLLSGAVFLGYGLCAIGSPLRPTTWSATDALGRRVPLSSDVKPLRHDRFVAVMYEPWLVGINWPLHDNTKILAQHPPRWGGLHAFHFWGEPEMGYYLSDDRWVIRKQMAMLHVAGVDAIFIDVTNAFIYEPQVNAVLETIEQMRAQGNPTPSVAFFLNSAHAQTARKLFDAFYRSRLNSSIWFRWQGKPLILCDPTGVDADIAQYFTFRKTWGLRRPSEANEWSFIQLTPQAWGWSVPGVPEQICASPAQQETYINLPTGHGRSYHNGRQPPPDQWDGWGRNFQEQLDRALEVDPQLVFISSWNEWIAQRFEDANGNTLFVDLYNEEFSRDVEPMRGGQTDNCYMQMVSFIRQYKGAEPQEPYSAPRTITVDGRTGDWTGVTPVYRDFIGDTTHRDHPGWGKEAGSGLHYRNETGRNDIVSVQVTHDRNAVYFLCRTAQPVSAPPSPWWMTLLIDTDRNPKTGWHGYDVVINHPVLDSRRTTVKQWRNGRWEYCGAATYARKGDVLEVGVPRALLGQRGQAPSFDFKWSDNCRLDGDTTAFALDGDAAPDRRFNYRYR